MNIRWLALVLFCAHLSGCFVLAPHEFTPEKAHQRFLDYQKWVSSQSIDDFKKFKNKLNSTPMGDGTDELVAGDMRRFKIYYLSPRINGDYCLEIYDYDAVTRKILKYSFEDRGGKCKRNS